MFDKSTRVQNTEYKINTRTHVKQKAEVIIVDFWFSCLGPLVSLLQKTYLDLMNYSINLRVYLWKED
jgi:hypothetical protein